MVINTNLLDNMDHAMKSVSKETVESEKTFRMIFIVCIIYIPTLRENEPPVFKTSFISK